MSRRAPGNHPKNTGQKLSCGQNVGTISTTFLLKRCQNGILAGFWPILGDSCRAENLAKPPIVVLRPGGGSLEVGSSWVVGHGDIFRRFGQSIECLWTKALA